MPRGPRLDAPGVLHHGMVRGIERRPIVRDDADRADCLARRAELDQAGAVTVDAWAWLPTHAHLLLRSGTGPLSRSLRSLLTGSAGVAYLWCRMAGQSGRPLAAALGLSH
ncbi:MAG TPA: transposase [Candidatus Methylomirabilis sp.]|nr:transposase [Candidatus Methylomirabilis sp.]